FCKISQDFLLRPVTFTGQRLEQIDDIDGSTVVGRGLNQHLLRCGELRPVQLRRRRATWIFGDSVCHCELPFSSRRKSVPPGSVTNSALNVSHLENGGPRYFVGCKVISGPDGASDLDQPQARELASARTARNPQSHALYSRLRPRGDHAAR